MPTSAPTPISIALEELERTLGLPVRTTPWSKLAPAANAALGGRFDPKNAQHRLLHLRLGALLGERVAARTGGFWFRQRDAVGGFSLGFPGAVHTVSPFSLAALALISGHLEGLDGVENELVSEAKAAAAREPAPKALDAHHYEQFFDPSLIEFVALDGKRAADAWALTPSRLVRELKDAEVRTPQLAKQTRDWLERELIAGLRALEQERPLLAQAAHAPRLIERTGELFGGRYGTGLTTEEGWQHAALPLLAIDPGKAPGEAQGRGVLERYLAAMPRREGTPEGGILGLFSVDQVGPVHPALEAEAALRLVRLNPRPLLPLLQKLDPEAVRKSVGAFAKAANGSLDAREQAVLDGTLEWLVRLQDTLALAVRDGLDFCLRRATEAEGRAGESKAQLRTALQA